MDIAGGVFTALPQIPFQVPQGSLRISQEDAASAPGSKDIYFVILAGNGLGVALFGVFVILSTFVKAPQCRLDHRLGTCQGLISL